jgi:predicted O-linked N-acetylglucosamine transferase (SPINDLY family)
VTWLGYPDTTGTPAMDFRFTDAHADPIETSDAFYTEKLIRLPGGFVCYQPPDDLPDVSPPPFEQRGHVTFGSFNNLAKISQRTVALWSRVMQSVPDAKLIIKSRALGDETTRSRLRDRFVAAGIEAGRLDIRGKEPTHASHLAAYGDVDIALDTFPYNGTMTTCEALAMGVPVIALAGQAHAGRVGVSLLTHAGMTEWIASDEDSFVAISQRLAGDQEKLREDRRTLRQRLLTSSLCDGEGFTREFESALETIWQRSLEKAAV